MLQTDTRDRLIVTAMELFKSKGYSGTTTRDIARASGTSLSNIAHYFGNKEGILIEVIKASRKNLIDTLTGVLDNDLDVLEKFRVLVRKHLSYIVEDPRGWAMVAKANCPEAEKVEKMAQREVLDIYRRMLIMLYSENYVRMSDTTVLAFNILGTLNWVGSWFRPNGSKTLDDVSVEVVNFISHGAFGRPD